MNLPSETTLNDFDQGYLIGILIGSGHFGGDGKQPQVTLRLDVRHERIVHWLESAVAGSKLYGPYHHGSRHYYQWMARGDCLRQVLLPVLERHKERLDSHTLERYQAMCQRYRITTQR